jgi:transposase-like protein
MSGKKGMKHYGIETKMLAVQMYFGQGLSQAEIAAELALPHKELVEQWVRRYRQEGEVGFQKPIGRPRKSPLSQLDDITRLKMENELLKKFHSELRKAMLARRNIGSSNTTEEATR